MILLNNTTMAEGGPFTRKDPSNPYDNEKKSCLDLALASKDLIRYVKKLLIDKDERFEMGRVIVKNGVKCLVKPDHYTMILELNDVPINRNKVSKDPDVRFNLKKQDGWTNYKALTEVCDDLLKIVRDEEADIESVQRRFDNMHTKIKFKSFGKTRIKLPGNKQSLPKITEDTPKNEQNNEQKMIEDILKQKAERLQQEIKELKSSSTSRPTRTFKLLEKIQGPKKCGPEAVAIVDPTNNDLKTTKDEILVTTVSYCANLLTNNAPDPGYERDLIIKNKLHDARMNVTDDEQEVFSDDDFKKALERFEGKKKSCYNFLTKAGKDFQEATKIFLHRIWETENIPVGWEYTLLIMLYKGVGLKEIMDNNRFIHSKNWMPRLFEDIVVSKMKSKIQDKVTKYQIWGMKGHRSTEHLFSVKRVIAYYTLIDKPLIAQCIDIRKFFDKENLRDAMNTLHSAGVHGKAYRLWYKLNKNTRIAVKTGVGLTDERDTGETLGQGTSPL